MTVQFSIRPTGIPDQDWIRNFIRERWGDEIVVVHGTVYRPDTLSGFAAEDSRGDHLGLATYLIQRTGCELVSLDSLREGLGIGSALVKSVQQAAIHAGCSKLWCITTNDNRPALKFYHRRGFEVVAVHQNAVARSRVLKPSIPLFGIGGDPIQDEIELQLKLDSISRD